MQYHHKLIFLQSLTSLKMKSNILQTEYKSIIIVSLKFNKYMKRYFYEASPLLKKWLENQYNFSRREDQIFRNAMLTAIKLTQKGQQKYELPKLHETILEMTIQQQKKYSTNLHLELLFDQFSILHNHSQGRNMLMRGGFSAIKDLVDPDKFPIWDSHKKTNLIYPKWNYIMGKIRYDVGFELSMNESQVQHPSGGRGVFINLSKFKQKIQVGELIGFVPGIIYESYPNYEKIKLQNLKSYERIPEHLHFPSGKVLEFSHIKIDEKDENSQVVDPTYINPFAFGHLINHPPIDKSPNVCFSQIEIPLNFFPSYLKKYLPYNSLLSLKAFKNKGPTLHIFGIFALKQIKNGEELFVNYLQNHIYPIEDIPQWLIEPEEVHNYYQKKQYEYPLPQYWKQLEKKALSKRQGQFDSFQQKIKRKPGNTLYEDDKIKIRSAKKQQ